MAERTYGRTKSGKVVTDADIERDAAEAEAGYDVDELIRRRGKRGRPRLGSGPASVESVRLDPQPREALAAPAEAEAEGTSTSEVIRQALRQYLAAG